MAADLHAFAAARGVCGSTSSIPSRCVQAAMVAPSVILVRILQSSEVVIPPSTGSAAPVTPHEAGPHNQATKAAGSAGSSRR